MSWIDFFLISPGESDWTVEGVIPDDRAEIIVRRLTTPDGIGKLYVVMPADHGEGGCEAEDDEEENDDTAAKTNSVLFSDAIVFAHQAQKA